MNTPETRSARKRRAILSAATVVFLREGFAGTTMDQVAALAEVSKLTIYRHFSDKSALFTAVVVSTVDEPSDLSSRKSSRSAAPATSPPIGAPSPATSWTW
jgi:AcrR family transcriptional regulator